VILQVILSSFHFLRAIHGIIVRWCRFCRGVQDNKPVLKWDKIVRHFSNHFMAVWPKFSYRPESAKPFRMCNKNCTLLVWFGVFPLTHLQGGFPWFGVRIFVVENSGIYLTKYGLVWCIVIFQIVHSQDVVERNLNIWDTSPSIFISAILILRRFSTRPCRISICLLWFRFSHF